MKTLLICYLVKTQSLQDSASNFAFSSFHATQIVFSVLKVLMHLVFSIWLWFVLLSTNQQLAHCNLLKISKDAASCHQAGPKTVVLVHLGALES